MRNRAIAIAEGTAGFGLLGGGAFLLAAMVLTLTPPSTGTAVIGTILFGLSMVAGGLALLSRAVARGRRGRRLLVGLVVLALLAAGAELLVLLPFLQPMA